MSLEKRITLKKIAEVAGVHQTTVSLALRNRPSLPEKTRLRIQKIAKRMGYRPDPALQALSVYRYPSPSGEVPIRRFSMAFLTNERTHEAWKKHSGLALCRTGAIRRAAELGYHLTDFWLEGEVLTSKRITRILNVRNIHGIIVAPLLSALKLDLEWEYFSCVSITSSLHSPQLHTIRNDHIGTAQITHRRLQELGYRRIGLAVSRHSDERIQRGWTSGFWSEEGFLPDERKVPPYLPPVWNMEGFADWLQRYKPDAIISIPPNLDTILEWFKERGIRVPEDIGVASLDCNGNSALSGVLQLPELIGATAVETLGGLIQRNNKGIPERPQATIICGDWVDGQTTRPQPGATVNSHGSKGRGKGRKAKVQK